ncbi:hypothetical protein MTR67_044545 [Solanum verrucosum]|uniref:Reverse transcriptase RNase H-like domain-containing protein n=1 Tax=Solanum verrucosum TaxID=315347 RepID=A0AAF0UR20_SOLVR|nr:hypothetical protein MTR67_044545 [Solanum verrucosum]
MSFLGHVVSKENIMVDSTKIKVVQDWTWPTSSIEIQSFVGLASYCRKVGLGCVMMQEEKVIVYALRHLKVHEKNYPNHDMELATVVFASKIWRHHCVEFIVKFSPVIATYNRYSIRRIII